MTILFFLIVSIATVTNSDKQFNIKNSFDGVIQTTTIHPNVPGTVVNLTAEGFMNSVLLTWQAPVNGTENLEYIIYSNTNAGTVSTNKTTYVFENLGSCREYTFTVSAKIAEQDGENATIVIKTLTPQVIFTVEQYKLTENHENILTATWKPPKLQDSCIDHYKILVKDGETVIHDNITKNTSYEISPLVGCMEYNVQVVPISNVTEIGLPSDLNHVASEKAMNPPKATQYISNKTWALLTWQTDEYKINRCAIKMLRVDCEALADENEEKDWIQRMRTEQFNITDDSSRPSLRTNITYLSEFTNYTCYGTVINTKGASEKSLPVKFQTAEEVPTPPHNVHIQNITAKSFVINWQEPLKVPGILEKYEVAIRNATSNHHIPPECGASTTEDYNFILSPDITTFNFHEAQQDFNYNIYLKAFTRVGNGTASSQLSVNTLFSEPEKPRNFNYTLQNIPLPEYNVTLKWTLPCNTNGNLSFFYVRLNSTPNYDLEKAPRQAIVVFPNENIANISYEIILYGMKPAYNHSISVQAVLTNNAKGKEATLNFTSPDGYPGPPIFITLKNLTENSFDILWAPPKVPNGRLLSYSIKVEPLGADYDIPQEEECMENLCTYEYEIDSHFTQYAFNQAKPYHKYEISVTARTSAGYGEASQKNIYTTLEKEPQDIRYLQMEYLQMESEDYNVQIKILFKPPCHTYGVFNNYIISIKGKRSGYENHIIEYSSDKTKLLFAVKPEFDYSGEIIVKNQAFQSNGVTYNFLAPPGVPKNVTEIVAPPAINSPTEAAFTFSNSLFDESNGKILYYSLILKRFGEHENSTFGRWMDGENTWPSTQGQLTPKHWNPFKEFADVVRNYTFYIGNGDCSPEENYCNNPLQPDTVYAFKIRAFTRNAYRDAPTIIFQTDPLSSLKLTLIMGVIFGIILVGALIIGIRFMWKKRVAKRKEKLQNETSEMPPSIPIKHFSKHYRDLMQNDKLQAEYSLLCSKSAEITKPSYLGLLPENRKKNRYCNILPYDDTRVKLELNDESSSSYINASYINGFSGTVEYIATQGPLENTCVDFWEMILQEHVIVIVMLAQLVEQNKNKCFKYFPDNHGTMQVGDEIKVQCNAELNFGTHVVRTLVVKKDLIKMTVTHMQYMEWPDFGCPKETNMMLYLCKSMRKHIKNNNEKILVHCSAGVGRTGSLIAIDIILQQIKYKKDINVFATILQLRKQRKNMVQTEKQYMYIYSCIKNAIENPEINGSQHRTFYENLSRLKFSITSKLSGRAF